MSIAAMTEQHVPDRSFQFLAVPDNVIVTFMLPEGTSAVEYQVGLARSVPFKGLEHLVSRNVVPTTCICRNAIPTYSRIHQVHVVRHDREGKEVIPSSSASFRVGRLIVRQVTPIVCFELFHG